MTPRIDFLGQALELTLVPVEGAGSRKDPESLSRTQVLPQRPFPLHLPPP